MFALSPRTANHRFQSLPVEIITQIAECLDPWDIVSLLDCIDVNVTRTIYQRVFPNDCIQQEYNLAMFQRRMTAEVCFWADGNVQPGACLRSKAAWSAVRQLSMSTGGCMLGAGGDIYVCDPRDVTSFRVRVTKPVPSLWRYLPSNILNGDRIRTPRRWHEMACYYVGRAVGIDAENPGCLWILPTFDDNTGDLFVLEAEVKDHRKLLRSSLCLLRVGADVNGCLVRGYGVAVWTREAENGSRKYRGRKVLDCTLVPGTEDITDFTICGNVGVFVHCDGTVTATRLQQPDSEESQKHTHNLTTFSFAVLNKRCRHWGGFHRAVASKNDVMLRARNGTYVVLQAVASAFSQPDAYVVYCPLDLADLVMGYPGYSENIALTKKGEAFFWKHWVWHKSVGETIGNLEISEFVKMDVPGRAVGISASQWYSMVTFIRDEEHKNI